MRIAISGLVTPRQPTGVGRYLAGLLSGFAALDHDDEITVYVGADCPEEILAVRDGRIRFVRLRLRHDPRLVMRPLYLAWQQLRPAAASADVLHLPNLVPTLGRRMPLVTSVHDLAEWEVPEKYPPARRAYRRLAARAIARWSDRVLVPTATTRDDLVARLGLPADRVVVAPFGVDDRFWRARHDAPPAAPAEQYLLYVGSDLAHKNLDRLLAAAAEVLPSRATRLVLAGVAPTSPRVAGVDRRWVEALGRVDADSLTGLYLGATGVVFPSLAEGFGLPILEAFAVGCPVLTSAGTACAEVAGDAALLVDPTDTSAIAGGMRRLLDDAGLRRNLVAAGRERGHSFTWTRCAQITRGAFEAAIAAHHAEA
jgi:glycosyltransferase involved in cell wall biosynthesis